MVGLKISCAPRCLMHIADTQITKESNGQNILTVVMLRREANYALTYIHISGVHCTRTVLLGKAVYGIQCTQLLLWYIYLACSRLWKKLEMQRASMKHALGFKPSLTAVS